MDVYPIPRLKALKKGGRDWQVIGAACPVGRSVHPLPGSIHATVLGGT